MPVAVSYPGVYVEEIPSGVHTITGVATSIAAFLGRAAQGPVNVAMMLTSYSDFVRTFGGFGLTSAKDAAGKPITITYPLAHAVRDFFLNGGSQAVVVRLFAGDAEANASKANVVIPGGLTIQAVSAGKWGAELSVVVEQFRLPAGSNNFNLRVYRLNPDDLNAPRQVEIFRDINCTAGDKRFVTDVLQKESDYVRAPKDTVTGKPTTFAADEQKATIKAAMQQLTGGAESGALNARDLFLGDPNAKTGLYALDKTDLFNLLCLPFDDEQQGVAKDIYGDALAYCVQRRAFLIVDPPAGWEGANETVATGLRNNPRDQKNNDLGLTGPPARNAAVFYPRVRKVDPMDNQEKTFPPCGVVAGIFARTDATRGVWKAPAGTEATLSGIRRLSVKLTDAENGILNPVGINCLRSFPAAGNVVWGARTLQGDDQQADDYKYIPVRRLALYIEESLYRGTQWAVFEPNDEPLWAQLRLNVGSFMHDLFRQHAFQGSTPKDAYFVKCDKETTTQSDINRGVVNLVIGFAPLKPAEFVIIQLQQLAGQLDT